MYRWATLAIVGLLGVQAATLCGQGVISASVASDGLVHISLAAGREYVAAKETRVVSQRIGDSEDQQASVEVPIVAPDRRTVGWIVNFPNCCTSYPIPLTLVIFRNGRIAQRFTGIPIWKFAFEKNGAEVAFYMDTLHGESAAWCQLRDTSSGRLLGEWRRGSARRLPKWADPFANDIKDR